MTDGVAVRALSSIEECREAATLIDRIWGETRIVTPELLWAMTTHGGLVLVAERDGVLVGAQMGFLGLVDDELVLHSHVTGVPDDAQHAGIGFALKRAQRDWSVARGIATVTWTFDPLIARNAYFNLHKLGAMAVRFLPDFYGPMNDAFNAGDRTDRLEVRWELHSERVERALQGAPVDADIAGAEPLLEDADGRPRLRTGVDSARLLVTVPPDYLSLRSTDAAAAASWRDAVATALGQAMGRGYRGVDVHRPATYVLERS